MPDAPLFAPPPALPPRVRPFTVKLTEAEANVLIEHAITEGQTASDLIREALRRHLAADLTERQAA